MSAVITRARGTDGAIPLVAAYDINERTWNPPMPLLFQRLNGLQRQPIAAGGIRDLIRGALAASGITGTDGKPLDFRPHDFPRIFTTDAILNGMPPHIAQILLGHADISTTMGRLPPRSHQRPPRLQRPPPAAAPQRGIPHTPTDAEWDEFLGHFERRRVALGDCGRAYSTSCIHEHAPLTELTTMF